MTPPITPEERESVIALWQLVMPAAEIARRLRLPQETVLKVIEREKERRADG